MANAELIEADFDYSSVEKEHAAKLRYCAREIQKLKATAATSLMTIGEMLIIAHEQLANYRGGTFLKWVESECGFSKSTAYNYMAAFRVFGSIPTVGNLEDGAMYALAQNETPKKAIKEVLKLADKGAQITQKLAKEIIKKHKESGDGHGEGNGDSSQPSKPAPPPPSKPAPPPPTPEEQAKAERKKAKSYAEYLQRSIDDLNRLKRNPALHTELIKACGQILKGLERW